MGAVFGGGGEDEGEGGGSYELRRGVPAACGGAAGGAEAGLRGDHERLVQQRPPLRRR